MAERAATEADIVTLVSITSPLPLEVIAEALEADLESVAASVERLAALGSVAADRHGVSGDSDQATPTRRAMLASRLSKVLQRRHASPALVALAAWEAGDADTARLQAVSALGDRLTLDDQRLRLLEVVIDSGPADPETAKWRVERARRLRAAGRTDDAIDDLETATRHLAGEQLVDALALAAALEDDRQRPADAERTVAMALGVAANEGLSAKVGSLLTFHGRVLSRLGFDREAEASFDRGETIVTSVGSHAQRFYAGLNRAWADLDRGWAERAASGFEAIRAAAGDEEGAVSQADKDIYLARAKFQTGDASGARAALERARAVSEATDAPALEFLATIARAEGAVAFHRPADALAEVERLQDLVASHFPSWTNRASALSARAHLVARDRPAALAAIAVGRAATRHGANGLRLRSELDALELIAAPTWEPEAAADISDRLIQAGWLGSAIHLLIERSRRDRDSDSGRMAAALAHRMGNPLLAAEAIHAAELWRDEAADAVRLAIRRVDRQIPEVWRDEWRHLPQISAALASEPEASEESSIRLMASLDLALNSAGLGGVDAVLSPAQRRAAGLVPEPSRTATVTRWVLPLIGAAAVAMVVALGFRPDAPDVVVPEFPTPTVVIPTTVPDIADTPVEASSELIGQSPFAGGDGRNAIADATVGAPTGFYWQRALTGFVRSDPILRGKAMYVGTSEGFVTALDISRGGSTIFEEQAGGPLQSSFASEQVSFDQGGQSRAFVFYGTGDGTLTTRNIDDSRGIAWSTELGSPLSGPALVRADSVIVSTVDGVIRRLRGDDGSELARFPLEGVIPSGIDQPLAASDGTLYVVATDGTVRLIDEETFEPICETAVGATTHAVVTSDRWYVGTDTTAVFAYAAGTCSSGGGIPAYQIDVPIQFAPVVVDGIMWTAADEVMLAIDVADGTAAGAVGLDANITSPPVIAGETILVGATRAGANELIAIDRTAFQAEWRFPLDGIMRQRPLVADDVVIVAVDQNVIAIATPAG